MKSRCFGYTQRLVMARAQWTALVLLLRNLLKTLAYNPDKVIRNTVQLMQYLPDSNIIITTYNQNDVEKILSDVPSPDKFEILHNGFGVSQVHEIFYDLNEDKCIKWKKLSSDSKYSDATIKIKETVLRK